MDNLTKPRHGDLFVTKRCTLIDGSYCEIGRFFSGESYVTRYDRVGTPIGHNVFDRNIILNAITSWNDIRRRTDVDKKTPTSWFVVGSIVENSSTKPLILELNINLEVRIRYVGPPNGTFNDCIIDRNCESSLFACGWIIGHSSQQIGLLTEIPKCGLTDHSSHLDTFFPSQSKTYGVSNKPLYFRKIALDDTGQITCIGYYDTSATKRPFDFLVKYRSVLEYQLDNNGQSQLEEVEVIAM